jgi:hypothetical protein
MVEWSGFDFRESLERQAMLLFVPSARHPRQLFQLHALQLPSVDDRSAMRGVSRSNRFTKLRVTHSFRPAPGGRGVSVGRFDFVMQCVPR